MDPIWIVPGMVFVAIIAVLISAVFFSDPGADEDDYR